MEIMIYRLDNPQLLKKQIMYRGLNVLPTCVGNISVLH